MIHFMPLSTRQHCPNCLLFDHTAEECALNNPRPGKDLGSPGSAMRCEEKHMKGGYEERQGSG